MILLARIISVATNPLIISIPMSFALVFRTSGDFSYSLSWTLISLIFSSVVGAFVYYGVLTGLFSDFDISRRMERPKIFLFTAIVSFVYLLFIIILNGPKIILLSLGGLLLGIFLDSVINTKIKASVHLAGFSAFSLTIGILYGGYLWLFLLFAPLVAWSRIKLKRHVLAETIIGTLLGISLVMVLYLVIQYLYEV